jgi:hypothetical protein
VAEISTIEYRAPLAGAVYKPLLEMLPKGVEYITCQVTAVLLLFCTVAVNCWVPPNCTFEVAGEMETATGGMIVTEAEADFVGSATETAVTVTGLGLGTAAGV